MSSQSIIAAGIKSSYLLSLLVPVYALLFVLSGPHSIVGAIEWIVPLWLTVLVDMWSPESEKEPESGKNRLRYDAILYLLAALQIITILSLLNFSLDLTFGDPLEVATCLINLFAVKVIVGTSSSFSGIVVAHELIHRSTPSSQTLGRLLLVLECYEHFATEHIRGHHRNFASPLDPATARLGESYEDFWKRTVPAQFKSAWQLENRRLGIDGAIAVDRRFLFHRVAQGLVLEIALLLYIGYAFGIAGLLVFAIQAIAAVRKLEAVNYIEHWGLNHRQDLSPDQRAWDTESWFTLNAMVGLSRHSDHHTNINRPFYQLEYAERSPKLPYGYFTTVFLAVFSNQHYQSMVQRELLRTGLLQSTDEAGTR